jgi:hypothetical protein
MEKRPTRIRREGKTIEAMIGIYCRGHHDTGGKELCPDCAALREYARMRLDRCPFQEQNDLRQLPGALLQTHHAGEGERGHAVCRPPNDLAAPGPRPVSCPRRVQETAAIQQARRKKLATDEQVKVCIGWTQML